MFMRILFSYFTPFAMDAFFKRKAYFDWALLFDKFPVIFYLLKSKELETVNVDCFIFAFILLFKYVYSEKSFKSINKNRNIIIS